MHIINIPTRPGFSANIFNIQNSYSVLLETNIFDIHIRLVVLIWIYLIFVFSEIVNIFVFSKEFDIHVQSGCEQWINLLLVFGLNMIHSIFVFSKIFHKHVLVNWLHIFSRTLFRIYCMGEGSYSIFVFSQIARHKHISYSYTDRCQVLNIFNIL